MKRSSGILAHISSLPGEYGIGTLGKEAYHFVDFLEKAGQSYWQVLPIGPTSYGDSPYSSLSSFAGNPYFIDFDLLTKDRLLKKKDYQDIKWSFKEDEVDYGILFLNRYRVLRIAVKNFKENDAYLKFEKENKFWLDDYALFMAIKDSLNDISWLEWPDPLRLKEAAAIKEFIDSHKEDIRFYKVIQYFFYKQFKELKAYANLKGISIFGDCPIYVAMDSSDVWGKPELFLLDKNKMPVEVACVPPDYYSETGQLWGNPLYDWSKHKKDDYAWWTSRLKHLTNYFDAIRIDHFIGFDSYCSVNYGDVNAINFKRHKGPGMKLINVINEKVKNVQIIAEDLGALTSSMRKLLADSGFPGMKVLRFGFDGNKDNEHLPHMYLKNTVAYVSSHDTETCMGWLNHTSYVERSYINEYFKISDYNNFNWIAIDKVSSSRANLMIIQLQDLLGIGDNGRMNTPATSDGKNWKWRMQSGVLDGKLARKLKVLTEKNNRI